jgi:CPA2 family monovalent cation:H+ antiporter-2
VQAEHDLLKSLAVVLGVAAVTGIVSRRLRQPVVVGYLVAGLVIGPHVPIPLVADPAAVHTMSELGVVLLMFSLGLELSLRRLFRVGPSVAVTAVVQCSLLLWLGFATGRLFGWTARESLFAGAVVAISSTGVRGGGEDPRRAEPPRSHGRDGPRDLARRHGALAACRERVALRR